MSENKFRDCADLPQVAMGFMNRVHCDELDLVNALLLSLGGGDAKQKAEIERKLDDWLAHTIEHFAREERLMQEHRFPPYPVHKQAHEQALETLKSVQQQYLETGDSAALEHYIKAQWWPWLQQHLSTMDLVTANFLAQFDIQLE